MGPPTSETLSPHLVRIQPSSNSLFITEISNFYTSISSIKPTFKNCAYPHCFGTIFILLRASSPPTSSLRTIPVSGPLGTPSHHRQCRVLRNTSWQNFSSGLCNRDDPEHRFLPHLHVISHKFNAWHNKCQLSWQCNFYPPALNSRLGFMIGVTSRWNQKLSLVTVITGIKTWKRHVSLLHFSSSNSLGKSPVEPLEHSCTFFHSCDFAVCMLVKEEVRRGIFR